MQTVRSHRERHVLPSSARGELLDRDEWRGSRRVCPSVRPSAWCHFPRLYNKRQIVPRLSLKRCIAESGTRITVREDRACEPSCYEDKMIGGVEGIDMKIGRRHDPEILCAVSEKKGFEVSFHEQQFDDS